MLNLNQDKLDDTTKSSTKAIPEGSGSLNALESLKQGPQNQWKVLVFDSFGRDIISSVLRVNDLFKVSSFIYL